MNDVVSFVVDAQCSRAERILNDRQQNPGAIKRDRTALRKKGMAILALLNHLSEELGGYATLVDESSPGCASYLFGRDEAAADAHESVGLIEQIRANTISASSFLGVDLDDEE